MKKTFVLLSVLKKKAKQIKRENNALKWHQALDAAAKEFGYTNFKNYQNTSKADIHQYKLALEIFLKDISLEDDVSKKIELSILFLQNHGTPFRDLLNILEHLQSAEADIQSVCDKLNLMKNELQNYLLDDFLSVDGQSDIEGFYQYYRAKDITISNLVYSISESELHVDGDYSLQIEFNGVVPEEYKNMPHFQEHTLCGDFDVIIDRNKEIIIQDASIGEFGNRGGPFTYEEIEEYYTQFPNERGRFDDILDLNDPEYDQIKHCLSNNEPLTGETLRLALDLVDVQGDDEHSSFIKNIGVKMKSGQPLDEYEHHILVDVMMLHAQLSS